jgi:acetyl/propionyl-CoA carboxylase alpha subunit
LHKDGSRPPFERILIANRGEIAVRILRAARELGMGVVAVYSDADAGAAHVRFADEAVRLGPAPAAESYLRAEAIVEAALRTGAQAIHPGYGFLAERASFAAAVEAAGLAFVGPSSTAIAALGDKLAARRLARQVGVPVVPGTADPAPVDGADRLDEIVTAAREIGFPLLVKAAAGGGGRGMRRVTRIDELPAALAAGSNEALAAFGDGSVYLEREMRPARHIEVQLLADTHGTVLALGERDCSLQRRHQKLIEESPAPGLSAEERRALHDHATRLAAAAGLVNAATAEFLFDESRTFAFLEVNTRLQVEHGVTELVADVDLVAEQFRIAAGAALSPRMLAAAARASDPDRHAIEVRLAAEDPAHGFAPTPGRVGRWRMPEGPGVRVDTAIAPGERIPPDYDPMIAKVLVVDADRPRAIDRLRRVLDEVDISGVQTTLPFHRFVASDASFRTGEVSIDWVEDHWTAAIEEHRGRALEAAQLAAAAVALGATGASSSTAPSPRGSERVSLRKDTSDSGDGWLRTGREHAMDRWPR